MHNDNECPYHEIVSRLKAEIKNKTGKNWQMSYDYLKSILDMEKKE